MADISMFNRILLVSIVSLFVVSNCLAQNKVDLELTVQSAVESVRGGETFAYSLTVRNIGSAKATNVILIQDEEGLLSFAAYVSSKGTCTINDSNRRIHRQLNCRLTDFEVGETVVVSVEMKVGDFGDVSITEESTATDSASAALVELMKATAAAKGKVSQIVGNADVAAKEGEENGENNHAPISVELLPSKNIPPRVKVLSPKEKLVFVRSSKKPLTVTFTIQAFDPDGEIEKVDVNTQQFQISVEYPENKYVIDGVKYSIKEVEENMPRFQRYFGGDAVKIGKDTYTFTLENPRYGINQVFIDAIDDGGRSQSSSVNFTVKSNNSIEFSNPVKNAVIKPHTDIIIETTTKSNDGELGKLQILGVGSDYEGAFMRLVSQKRNVFRHQYLLKNANRGNYSLAVLLIDDSGAITNSENLYFAVAEKPTVRISILSKRRIFKEGDEIQLSVEAFNNDGALGNASIFVNGKDEHFTWRDDDIGKHQHGYLYGLSKGTYTITAKITDDLNIAAESQPIIVVVR